MQKNIKEARNPEQRGHSSVDQLSILNNSQKASESQQALATLPLEPGFPTNREARLVALLLMIMCLAFFVLLTLAALVTQNLFFLSAVPIMARELAYMLRRSTDFLLLPRNSMLPTSKTPFLSVK